MLKNIPKELLKKFFNEEEIKIITAFYDQDKILDFDLSKKTNIEMNKLRKILQNFYYKGFANYIKEKSQTKEFWYDYIWYIDLPNFYTYLYKKLKEKVEDLESRIKKCKISGLFFCPDCGKVFDLMEAYNYDFICPDCNTPIVEKKIDFKKYEEKLEKYRKWMKILECYAKKEENINLEELFSDSFL